MTFAPDTTCPCAVRPAVNFGERRGEFGIDMLILHYTGMETADAALDWLCKEESGVSCHYFIYEDGRIVQLVPEAKRAWHAGQSSWRGDTDTNSRSIGIEIANPGHGPNYSDFPDAQIEAVVALSKDILERNEISAHHVLAHSDVAPGRKVDPGEKFPWKTLFDHGVGHWAKGQSPGAILFQMGDEGEPVSALQSMLKYYGYGLDVTGVFDQKTKDCVSAFQMHFRQGIVDGVVDGETIATLNALVTALE